MAHVREILPVGHNEAQTLMPGYPGRGYDPTSGFTDLQWYLFHQCNVAYFAAFAERDFDAGAPLTSSAGTHDAAARRCFSRRRSRPPHPR
jgi:hypothetical protein